MDTFNICVIESPLELSMLAMFGMIIYLIIQQFNIKKQMEGLIALKEEVAANIVSVSKVEELIAKNNKVAIDLIAEIDASDDAQTDQLNKITAILNGTVPVDEVEEEEEVVEEEEGAEEGEKQTA